MFACQRSHAEIARFLLIFISFMLPTNAFACLRCRPCTLTATEGPVSTPRPKLLDFLGRAKWDAWKQRENLSKAQAQEKYVETLMSILKAFSDRPQARELLEELREFPSPTARLGGSSYVLPTSDPQQRDRADYASTTSSQRSESPPPATATSRHSFHSALPAASAAGEYDEQSRRYAAHENDEEDTPRRPSKRASRRHRQQYGQQEEVGDLSRRAQASGLGSSGDDDRRADEEEEEYSDEDDDAEDRHASGSQTVSEASHEEQPRYRAGAVSSSQFQPTQRSVGFQQERRGQPPPPAKPHRHPYDYYSEAVARSSLESPPNLLPTSQRVSAAATAATRQPIGNVDAPYMQHPPPSQGSLPWDRQGRLSSASIRNEPILTRSTPELGSTSQQRQQQQAATIDRALDSIQTSLTALHERLNLMEQTQAALQASNDPRRYSTGFLSRSPVYQLIKLLFTRFLELIHLRRRSASAVGTRADGAGGGGLASLLGRALLSLLRGIRDVSRDAIAVMFLVAAVASLRNSRGDWRAVIRSWARILALATGIGVVREGGWLLGNGGGAAGPA